MRTDTRPPTDAGPDLVDDVALAVRAAPAVAEPKERERQQKHHDTEGQKEVHEHVPKLRNGMGLLRSFRKQLVDLRDAFIDHPTYRHSHAALTLDAAAALAGKRAGHRPHRADVLRKRPWRAAGLLVLLLALPAYGLLFGTTDLGDARGLAVGTLLTGLLLEWPGRRTRAERHGPADIVVPDPPSHRRALLVSGIELLGPGIAGYLSSKTEGAGLVDGLLWGAALAGALDFARTAAALLITSWHGEPAYDTAFHWVQDQRHLVPLRTWGSLAAFVQDKPRAQDFGDWCDGQNLTFALHRVDDVTGLMFVWDGQQVWIGNDAHMLPLSALGR